MISTLSRTDKEIIDIYNEYSNMIYKICYLYMKNKHDAEDMVQMTFLKLIKSNKPFVNKEHEKAFLILTASNTCKNHFATWFNKNTTMISDENKFISNNDNQNELLSLVLTLPNKYKIVIYLYYYEGYKTHEIANILNINESTIRSHLAKGRSLLKDKLKEEI